MKATLAIIALLSLTACGIATPVKRNFPDMPASLSTPCEPLKMVAPTDRLSDVLLTVTDNYSLYHECALKSEMWLKWYAEQKENFDSVK